MENNHYKDELRINGKIYKKINGKWTIVEKSDELGTDPKVNWIIKE